MHRYILRLRAGLLILLLTFLFSSCGSTPVESTTVPLSTTAATTIATTMATTIATTAETTAPTPSPSPVTGFPSLLSGAVSVVGSLKNADYQALADAVDPATGLRFSAYSYVDLNVDLVFTPSQIAAFSTDAAIYNWGSYDGTGDPIQLNANDYFASFVYSQDFETPHLIGVNNAIGGGNTLNNVTDAYPGASFVEFHFTGFDPQYEGMDWRSLTLVFRQMGGSWYLIGITHGQWTI